MLDWLSAGASVVGGLLGNKGANDAADKANKLNDEINKRNLQFAANATKIRVDDMRRAGINPLLAANPGAAASAPQQIAAQKADVGSVVSSAAGVGNMFTQSQQKDIAKERLALDTTNSAVDIAKKQQEIKNLATTEQATQAGIRLADSQTLTQETTRQAQLAAAGLSSAKTAESKIAGAEAQMRLDHIRNQGLVPWQIGVDAKNLGGGQYGLAGGMLSKLASYYEKPAGGDGNSGKNPPVNPLPLPTFKHKGFNPTNVDPKYYRR